MNQYKPNTEGEKMKTITQVAEELNVSRKKIYNEVERLNIKTTKEGKNNYISIEDYNRIKERIEEQNKERMQNNQERIKSVLERDRSMIRGNISDREYVDLKERISFLEGQLNIKDEQLQAKDFQINGLIQSNINISKSLQAPSVDLKTDIKEPKKSIFRKLLKK